MTRIAPFGVGALLALALAAGLTSCAEATVSANSVSATGAHEPWQLTAADEKECDEPAIAKRVRSAEKSTTEGAESGYVLAPGEMRDLDHSAEEIRAQEARWHGLSASDRLYQLCLAEAQGSSRS